MFWNENLLRSGMLNNEKYCKFTLYHAKNKNVRIDVNDNFPISFVYQPSIHVYPENV